MSSPLTLLRFHGSDAEVALLERLAAEGPVLTVSVDVADRPPHDPGRHATELGALEHVSLDLREEAYRKGIAPLIQLGGAGDPLWDLAAESVAGGAVAALALEKNATRLAWHLTAEASRRWTCAARAIAPELSVEPSSEDAEQSELDADGVLWGRRARVAGLWSEPELDEVFGEDAPLADEACELPEEVDLEFESGLPTARTGAERDGPGLVRQLGKIGARHALGQHLVVVDTALDARPGEPGDASGTQRDALFAPAAALIGSAHAALEEATLSANRRALKERFVEPYRRAVRRGDLHAPEWRDVEAFLESQQRAVSGVVRLRVFRGSVLVLGVNPGSGS